MTSQRRDFLLIVVALVAILGAGFGLGNLLGGGDTPTYSPPSVAVEDLEAETLAALHATLDLRPAQVEALRSKTGETSREILQTRERALFDYHLHMLRLHDRIAPDLDPAQQETLRNNRRKLRDTIEKRFPTLLDQADLAPPGGS